MTCWMLVSFAVAAPEGHANPDAETRVEPPVGSLIVDARVPAEVAVDGRVLGQLFVAGEFKVGVPVGRRDLTVVTHGEPEELQVDIPLNGAAVVLVGRNGTSTGVRHLAEPVPVAGEAAVEVRVLGDAPLQLRIDDRRFRVAPGEGLTVTLPTGRHAISVRNEAGTAIFASGTLSLDAPDKPSVLQLAEGRMPETSGAAVFQPSS